MQEAAKTLWTKHQYDVDILLNAAGVANLHDWLDDSLERTDLILDVNIKGRVSESKALCYFLEIRRFWYITFLGMVYVARTFMPKFYERRHGHIITIASLAGQIGCSRKFFGANPGEILWSLRRIICSLVLIFKLLSHSKF